MSTPTPKDEKDEKVPSVSDPRWREWSAPLWGFLNKGPKNWKSIGKWSRRAKMGDTFLRNCLAWLEESSLAICLDDGQGDIRWVGSRWMHRGSRTVDGVTPEGS